MAGTISLSLSQQFDIYGEPLAGGQLYLIQAGTVSTPQNGYQDLALTIPLPNPVTLDAAGRVPQFFLADGYIKVRLQDKHGVVQLASDNILVIGPSSGGGGGGATIDPTTISQTGDIKARYSTGVHPGATPGWVRCNGLTIGSAASSPAATERGNSDCNALFTLLWGADATLAVSGGRGASAAADWSANKTIATPDWRGCALVGVDGMGNSGAGRLTLFGAGSDTLGTVGGGESHVLVQAELPNVALGFTGTAATITVTGQANMVRANSGVATVGAQGGGTFQAAGTSGIFDLQTISASGNYTPAGTVKLGASTSLGSSTPVSVVQPTKLCTIYIKL